MSSFASKYFQILPKWFSGKKKKINKIKKNLSAKQETWVQSLGWEDSLEKEMATHPSILAWEIPWTGKPGGAQSIRLQRVEYDLETEK